MFSPITASGSRPSRNTGSLVDTSASAARATASRSDSGIPTMSAKVRSGSSLAQHSTKSAPLPAAFSSATIAVALALIASSMRLICRG